MYTILTQPTTLPRAPARRLPIRLIRLAAAVIAVVLFAVILLPGLVRDTSPGGPFTVFLSPEATNQAVFERYINEAWNAGNTDALPDLLTADHVCHEPGMADVAGIDGVAAMIASYRTAFPDWQFTIESITATEDEVWARLTASGTHTGSFALPDDTAIEATGNPVTFEVVLNARFADGKIAEQWMQPDSLGLMQQLGVTSPVSESVIEAQNLAVAQRVMDELWGGTNFDSASELYAPLSYWFSAHTDLRVSRLPRDWSEMYAALRQSMPDLQVTVRQMYAHGDMVTVHYAAVGTLENDYLTTTAAPMPGTGEIITWDGVFLYRMENGLIAEEWWYFDNQITGEIDYCQ